MKDLNALIGKTIMYFNPDFPKNKLRVAMVAGFDDGVGMCLVDKKNPKKIYFVTEGPLAPVWKGKFPQRFNESYALSVTSAYNMLISGYFSVPKLEEECATDADCPGDLVCPFGQ